jgi:ganglioside-induced differentiation-associated protein 1
MQESVASRAGLELYHAPSSYYSMIARFALAEKGVAYRPVFVDIHARMSQQAPDYVRLNPNMTVPTLVGPGLVLTESRNIAQYAYGLAAGQADKETSGWLDLHYSFPIEELTFGRLIVRRRLARVIVPRRLEAAKRRLTELAAAHPDLAALYRRRADVMASRILGFDPHLLATLDQRRSDEAIGLLDRLETTLSDDRETLVASGFGLADIVWTVFLARMEFTGMGAEILKRPALERYWRRGQQRPSFVAADIWRRMKLGRLLAGMLGFAA